MSIIFITGTPGTGKTTLARILAKVINVKCISIADLVKRKKLYINYDRSKNAFIIDIEKVRKEIAKLARKERIIVEGHIVEVIPPDMLEVCIVLRLNPLVLEKRLNNRGYIRKKILENIQSEILDVILIDALKTFGEGKVLELDLTGLTKEEAVKSLLDIIRGKIRPKPGHVDWIKRLGKDAYRYLRG